MIATKMMVINSSHGIQEDTMETREVSVMFQEEEEVGTLKEEQGLIMEKENGGRDGCEGPTLSHSFLYLSSYV